MSGVDFYESDRALGEYLLFHYGKPHEVLPWKEGPAHSLDYPVRCVRDCLDPSRLRNDARGLDLGCAVGRSTFELARHCGTVIGIDFSRRFVEAATQLRERGALPYRHAQEGALSVEAIARLPDDLPRTRVTFEQGDAQGLRPDLGQFDVVLMANLVDRLREPRRCLERLATMTRSGGQLIISTPGTWLEEYTPRANWLGGFHRDGKAVSTLDSLHEILDPHFEMVQVRDLPFLIREHARKYQWSVAQAGTWLRR